MLSNGAGGPTTIYLRKTFHLPFPADFAETLTLESLYDDGVVVYLNGQEVLRKGVPGSQDYLTLATGHEADVIESDPIEGLVDGPNILAVEVHYRLIQTP